MEVQADDRQGAREVDQWELRRLTELDATPCGPGTTDDSSGRTLAQVQAQARRADLAAHEHKGVEGCPPRPVVPLLVRSHAGACWSMALPGRLPGASGVGGGSDVGRYSLGQLRHEVELLLVIEEREMAASDELERHAGLAPDLEQRLDEGVRRPRKRRPSTGEHLV